MATQAVNMQGITSRSKPQPGLETAEGVVRLTRYREEFNQQIHQKAHALADEGSYFVTTNPTPNTGISTHAAPTAVPQIGSADTKPFFVYQNGSTPGSNSAVRTYFDYARFRCTGAGTAGTSINFCVILDAANANRSPGTGGTALTPINCNMDDGTPSVGKTVSAGATIVATTNTGRLFPNLQFRSVIPVVGDIYVVSFGPTEYPVGSLRSDSTSVCQQSFGHPPLIIGPGQWALFYLWLPAQTAASAFECDFGMWER